MARIPDDKLVEMGFKKGNDPFIGEVWESVDTFKVQVPDIFYIGRLETHEPITDHESGIAPKWLLKERDGGFYTVINISPQGRFRNIANINNIEELKTAMKKEMDAH